MGGKGADSNCLLLIHWGQEDRCRAGVGQLSLTGEGDGPGNPISSWLHSALQSESITANEPGDRIKYPLIAAPWEGLCQLSLPHA